MWNILSEKDIKLKEVLKHIPRVFMSQTKVFKSAHVKKLWRRWGKRQDGDFTRSFGQSL